MFYKSDYYEMSRKVIKSRVDMTCSIVKYWIIIFLKVILINNSVVFSTLRGKEVYIAWSPKSRQKENLISDPFRIIRAYRISGETSLVLNENIQRILKSIGYKIK